MIDIDNNTIMLYFKIDNETKEIKPLTYSFTYNGTPLIPTKLKDKTINFLSQTEIGITDTFSIPISEDKDTFFSLPVTVKSNVNLSLEKENVVCGPPSKLRDYFINATDALLKELTFNYELANEDIKASTSYKKNMYVITRKKTKISKQEEFLSIKLIMEMLFDLYDTTCEELEKGTITSENIQTLRNEQKYFNKPSLPFDITSILNNMKRKIIGQDEAIDNIVANVILNQRIIDLDKPNLLKTGKVSMLVDGPTGVGKTEIITELASEIKVPLALVSTTNYSGVGYVGEDLKSILVTLLRKTNGDLQKAMRGIVCFDEIDKLGDSTLEIRKGIAQELLTWISGTKILVKYDHKEYLFDTSKLTFIGLGAFTKMRDAKEIRKIGFGEIVKERKRDSFDTEDYIKFGMERELMGRMNLIVTLNNLTKDDMIAILERSEISPLKGLISVLESFNIEVTYSEDLVEEIALRASKDSIGARALQREVNKLKSKLLIPIMEGNINEINLTKEMLDDDFTLERQNKKALRQEN